MSQLFPVLKEVDLLEEVEEKREREERENTRAPPEGHTPNTTTLGGTRLTQAQASQGPTVSVEANRTQPRFLILHLVFTEPLP